MRMAPIAPLIVGGIILISGGAASGASAIGLRAAIHNCQNADIAPESRIEACSEVIRTNLASHDLLARFYYNRAAAYEAANDFDHASQDYDKALQLKPDFAEAQANRARLVEQHPASSSAVAPPGSR
jgi:tetratricopeptide (TPR) repeat protein